MSELFSTYPWRHWAKHRPDATAIKTLSGGIDWCSLATQIDGCHQYLAQMTHTSVSDGSARVWGTKSPNHLSLLVLLFACCERGELLLCTNPRFTTTQCAEIEVAMGVTVTWLDIAPLTAHLATSTPCSVTSLKAWDPARALTLTLTSGSTGTPKAVVHSPQTHLYSAEGLLSRLPFEYGDDWLLSLPLFHISGMAIVWRWLLKGAQLTIPGEDALASLSLVTHASLVPTQLQRFLLQNQIHQLKQVLLGGAAIPVELVSAAKQQGIACWCGYGMTEMASTVTMKPADKSAGVGTVIPRREMTLQGGEICLKGETLCLGYLRHGQIDSVTGPDGYFYSKDLGESCDGELFIRGRKDNMFISGGENIQPESIESILMQVDEIKRVMVLPIADQEYGSRPVAIVDASTFSSQHWHQWALLHLPGLLRPYRYYPWPQGVEQGGIKPSRREMAKWLQNTLMEE
ncbi:o-succinylbenzoate--CoA ligase [Thaumasiovibrio sp. DFM-14]|uniref:o-succinylbenzoate--CoA ligase n=1 Tax=Thaumasiovibrio sp. DFM-14 TaxID=3384792 RepID=UPI0039A0269E